VRANRNRRSFLKSTSAALSAALTLGPRSVQGANETPVGGQNEKTSSPDSGDTYETHAKGIRILPGQWRPHYPWEHIAWVSPSWPSQDYIWLDFPEAIFTSQGLLYLSHVNPPIPTVYQNLPRISWREVALGIAFDRQLPNGVSFGGSVTKGSDSDVDLELHLKNGSPEPLNNVTLQTCAFLRGIKEFGDLTRDNKFIHTSGSGWITMTRASEIQEGDGKYGIGWRTKGKKVADLPWVVTQSNRGQRFVAMTWFDDTLSMVSNPNHPCMHADPKFENLNPGEERSIRGKIAFFEGDLQDFHYVD